ncbi:MFS transporter, OPA family, solute carrier family 37, member 1/2 [Paragonimus westermani]|uniref:Sugar phosphate exchanger 3 n=1 Tax=Paragonimus westermani TaxID=34504 RepID=A0A5J4P187_9TREM|nr:MFS transporter, OPA family, solute carrier family 37, member 1/2 [Paragonimus westermani]
MFALAPGIKCLNSILPPWNHKSGRVYIFLCTFLIYTCYHISRKPISVVKSVLHENCTEVAEKSGRPIDPGSLTFCDWKPFDGDNYNSLFATLDLVLLSSYAVSMFLSGHAADRFNLRHYLGLGSVLCGASTVAFGLGYFFNVHSFAFYVIVQLVGGILQATGWPAVVASMGNWFGKSRRGFFMGVWNAHTSVGNILGSLIAGAFVESAWGWSFVVPGLLLAAVGVLTFFFLVPYPEELGLEPSGRQHKEFEYIVHTDTPGQSSEPSEDFINSSATMTEPILRTDEDTQAVSIWTALRVPGVVEYSLCLLFSKLVSYTFLFWLPNYITEAGSFNPTEAADLSAIFDLGGIAGGILAGVISDQTAASATICSVMLILGVPMLFVLLLGFEFDVCPVFILPLSLLGSCVILYIFHLYGVTSVVNCIGLLIPLGLLVNGPYALITTAVSADLGTHPSLRSSSRALATVTGIIDGTGSIGSALGPLLCGLLKPHGWTAVFAMLMTALGLAALLLIRRVRKEACFCIRSRRRPSPGISAIL